MAATATSPSPEQLERLADLIKTLQPASSSASTSWIDAVAAIGEFIHNAGWPLVVLAALLIFRRLINSIEHLKFGKDGAELQMRRAIAEAGAGIAEAVAPTGQVTGPSGDDLARSGKVEGLASGVDPAFLRKEAEALAGQYERTRASMAPGDARTRQLEIIMSKMRTLGRAVFPMRREFMNSPTPGYRLLAIACLQVAPDYELLPWLADRLPEERPFVGYHAAVALVVAARDQRASAQREALIAMKAPLEAARAKLPSGTDRVAAIDEFISLVDALPAPTPAVHRAI